MIYLQGLLYLIWVFLFEKFYREREKSKEVCSLEFGKSSISWYRDNFLHHGRLGSLWMGFSIQTHAFGKSCANYFSVRCSPRTREDWEILVGYPHCYAVSGYMLEEKCRDLFFFFGLLPFALFSLFWCSLWCLGMLLRMMGVDIWRHMKAKKKKLQVKRDLRFMTTGLILAVQAGCTLHDAWNHVAKGTGPLYEEMRKTEHLMREGCSIRESYQQFGRRYPIEELREIAGLLIQNLEQGSRTFIQNLESVRKKQMERQRFDAQEDAQRAMQEMLFPSLLLFVGILLLILVPMLHQTL